MKIGIGIKAYNEAEHIEQAIRSALEAAEPWNGQVFLSDSGSTDDTVDVAVHYPISIVTLASPEERSCGVGAQLAFASSEGEYFYLMDGDMELRAAFLGPAIAFLDDHPDVAGVGGRVLESHLETKEAQIRNTAMRFEAHRMDGDVDRLDGGGLYRRRAIEDVGYFADRNLHALEELDLGARLRARGWRLVRLPHDAVYHTGYRSNSYVLAWRKFRAKYPFANGEIVRAAIGKAHMSWLILNFRALHWQLMIMLWWLCIAILAAHASASSFVFTLFMAVISLPFFYFAMRRRSISLGIYSLYSWNLATIGFVRGLFSRRLDPTIPIKYRRVRTAGR